MICIDLATVCGIVQVALHRIERWCKDHHGLTVNPLKTEMVLFTHEKSLKGLSLIKIFGKELISTNQVHTIQIPTKSQPANRTQLRCLISS